VLKAKCDCAAGSQPEATISGRRDPGARLDDGFEDLIVSKGAAH
jgi:hypothetical protein